ncbi:hypothetical protein JZ751_013057 [Albula glossodonta]|uniref:Uncharacterized protein n=1 Tax=Albula glossodonta TaxID=121402 RepID=A0A8T2NTY6_9TELE|nr:hypothetical protein JZ751_013057 [Albula glossodonta]
MERDDRVPPSFLCLGRFPRGQIGHVSARSFQVTDMIHCWEKHAPEACWQRLEILTEAQVSPSEGCRELLVGAGLRSERWSASFTEGVRSLLSGQARLSAQP